MIRKIFERGIIRQLPAPKFDGLAAFFVLMTFFETNLRWFYQILSHGFHLLDHVKEACQTWGLFCVNLSGVSECDLSALFMLPVLMKCANILTMYSAFLLFQ